MKLKMAFTIRYKNIVKLVVVHFTSQNGKEMVKDRDLTLEKALREICPDDSITLEDVEITPLKNFAKINKKGQT